jgi:hypothetical protein
MTKCVFKECRRPACGEGSFPEMCEECAKEVSSELERLADKVDEMIRDDTQKN